MIINFFMSHYISAKRVNIIRTQTRDSGKLSASTVSDISCRKTAITSPAGKKCIVIAHRLSTIRQCDRILLLQKGKQVEDGSYDELIAKNGPFAELVRRQMVTPK